MDYWDLRIIRAAAVLHDLAEFLQRIATGMLFRALKKNRRLEVGENAVSSELSHDNASGFSSTGTDISRFIQGNHGYIVTLPGRQKQNFRLDRRA
jgi:hypothetical protein